MPKAAKHILINEREWVEKPLLDQLEKLGWTVIDLKRDQKPEESFRESFDEVVLLPELRESLRKINDWMDEDQIDEAIAEITRFQSNDLIANNERVLELLREGTSVSTNRRTGDKSPTVKYIDFDHTERNSFVAICQLKLRVSGTDRHIYPDIVLFVNGLPIGVIECKSPKVYNAIAEAINQLLRYSEQRGEKGEESNKELFYYNQFMVATSRDKAKIATITAPNEKLYFNWDDPFPMNIDELQQESGSTSKQHRLVAGAFSLENCLSLIRTFIFFTTNDSGHKIKILARYQQFRAVKKAVNRLLSGETKEKRSGLVWHTQGSGKSFTMMFMVREMYIYPELTSWKVIYVTDRTKLEKQLTENAVKAGLSVNVAKSISKLKELLPTNTSEVVMAMIHKFQDDELGLPLPKNESEKILVMTDEAHRGQFKTLGSQLDAALPNATLIGYTGTPTDKAEQRFGDYIDTYTMREAKEDGVTVEIVYEGRTHKAEIDDREAADQDFKDAFEDYTPAEQLQIFGQGGKTAYLEDESTINAKARDMIEHYVSQVFANGFKAQVVTQTREAAARYKDALDQAIDDKIIELKENNPDNVNIETLKKLKTETIISPKHNDLPHLNKYTDEAKHDQAIASFKLRFDEKDDSGNTGEVGILIVANMLLVGFDAPIEQVMYLDKVLTMHNLLQAIARVNRVYNYQKGNETVEKDFGFIVDYVGVGYHLQKALADYNERDKKEVEEPFITKEEIINQIQASQEKIKAIIAKSGISGKYDFDSFYDLFYDEDLRFEFILTFREYAKLVDALYPNKEALRFVPDLKYYSEINAKAEQHFQDKRIRLKGIKPKLRKIVDDHLVSKGIDLKIEPISILNNEFTRSVGELKRSETKASAIEHAIRHFIEVNFDEDPTLYETFSEQLEQILQTFRNNWNEIYEQLEKLRQTIIKSKNEDTYGLNPNKQMPFFRKFQKHFFDNEDLTDERKAVLVALTIDSTEILERELRLKGFWDSIPAQNKVKAHLFELILSPEYKDKIPEAFQKRNSFVSETMQIAKLKNDTILYG
ncbi:MAG: type I restriction endonuclease subunit R [Pyrinomonadaceae bacterium]